MKAGLILVEVAKTSAGVQHLIAMGLMRTCITVLSAARYSSQHTSKAQAEVAEALVLCQCCCKNAVAKMAAAAGCTVSEARQAALQLIRYLVHARDQEGRLNAANGIANLVNLYQAPSLVS